MSEPENKAVVEAKASEEALASLGEVRTFINEPAVVPMKAVEPVATKDKDDDDDDLPVIKGEKPEPQDWKNLREIAKTSKQKIKEMEAQIRELEGKKVTPTPEPRAEVKTEVPADVETVVPVVENKNTLSDEDTFLSLIQARTGEFDKDSSGGPGVNSRNIEKLALDCIQVMGPEKILKVMDKARQGGFGDQSGDILVVAREALVEVTARKDVDHDNNERESARTKEFEGKVSESYGRVVKDIPDLTKTDSEFYVFAKDWSTKNILVVDGEGKITKTGPLIGLLNEPNWPETVYPMIYDAFKASKLGKVEGELAETRKKVDTLLTPESSGHRNGSGSGNASSQIGKEATELESKLAGMGNIR